MNPSDYIKMCQQVAVLPAGALGIKLEVPDELLVVRDGVKYYPVSRTVSFDRTGEMRITANVHDLKSNCVLNCDIRQIEPYKKG